MRIALDGRMSTPRKEMIDILERNGHIIDSNIDSETDFLVQSNVHTERITSKLRQAIQEKVKIITEDELYEILETS